MKLIQLHIHRTKCRLKLKNKNNMANLKNDYSLFEKLQLGVWLIRTKMIEKRARLFRFPMIIRGRKFIDFGENLTTGVGCRFDCFPGNDPNRPKLHFGKNVQINDYVHFVAMDSVRIGDNVLMASHIFISDNSHGCYKGGVDDSDPNTPPTQRAYATNPISIGDNTWIGEGVIIMPGVTIGKGCVIGAHSVVSKSIPDYCVAVGSPARPIKKYDFENRKWIKI